jgi:hypothetical protein
MTKVAAQNPPNDWYTSAGHVSSAPTPYRHRPQMKTAL